MDPLEAINPKKDSTVAMLQSAQRMGWQLYCMEQRDIFISDGEVYGRHRQIRIHDHLVGLDRASPDRASPDRVSPDRASPDRVSPSDSLWYEQLGTDTGPLSELDLVLLRKDPPFDMEYIYLTYLLELAEQKGVPVANRPSSVRDCNEKLFALQFPNCCPPHMVSRDTEMLRSFQKDHGDVVFKPLDGMGGASIFRVRPGDKNLSVIVETLTANGTRQAMVQRFIPEISQGDTRILLINGEPVPFGLARIPAEDENRGNLAAGGAGMGRKLNDRDRFICQQVGPVLVEKGLYFVGIDIIGDYLTEINVTCPTCIREIDAAFGTDIASDYLNFLEGAFR